MFNNINIFLNSIKNELDNNCTSTTILSIEKGTAQNTFGTLIFKKNLILTLKKNN